MSNEDKVLEIQRQLHVVPTDPTEAWDVGFAAGLAQRDIMQDFKVRLGALADSLGKDRHEFVERWLNDPLFHAVVTVLLGGGEAAQFRGPAGSRGERWS